MVEQHFEEAAEPGATKVGHDRKNRTSSSLRRGNGLPARAKPKATRILIMETLFVRVVAKTQDVGTRAKSSWQRCSAIRFPRWVGMTKAQPSSSLQSAGLTGASVFLKTSSRYSSLGAELPALPLSAGDRLLEMCGTAQSPPT